MNGKQMLQAYLMSFQDLLAVLILTHSAASPARQVAFLPVQSHAQTFVGSVGICVLFGT
jgi:hypothetical protein